MDSTKHYCREDIELICSEVARQWECHLIARAAFPPDIMKYKTDTSFTFRSRSYYQKKGISLKISVPVPLSSILSERLPDVPHWLNQNFVLRLYGILDEYQIITAGKEQKNIYTDILARLRHKVGAHSRGFRNSDKAESKKLTHLIQQHLDSGVVAHDVEHFHLPIRAVLCKLKNRCLEFVWSLEGKPVPTKRPASQDANMEQNG